MFCILLHQITHWQDPNLSNVLDIYQASFPPNEQMRLSWWVRLLNELSLQNGPAGPERLLYAALGDDPNNVVGFAYCEVDKTKQLAYLVYFAMHEDVRGQGMGSLVYQQLADTLFVSKNTEIIVFEVEKPEVMAGEISRRGTDRGATYRLVRAAGGISAGRDSVYPGCRVAACRRDGVDVSQPHPDFAGGGFCCRRIPPRE